MRFSPYMRAVWIVALLFSAGAALAVQQGTVSSVAIVSNNPFQLQIRTNGTQAPQSQIVSSPERLVVDIPNALPGPALHGIAVHLGEIRGVRISLFSATPPITRIVVDLNQPQWYKVTPNATGVLVSLGSDSESAVDTQSTIGWVSTKSLTAAKPAITQIASFQVKKGSATSKTPSRKGLSIEFADGLMTIHSGGATLSEILFQIQKVTGAEIAIPAGTEQDKVAADFGPGPASEVLGELLNGTGLNFVVVGSEADHNTLRSVILSRKSETQENPSSVAQTFTPPPTADNVEPEYQEAPPPDSSVQNQNMEPDRDPQPDPNAQPGQQAPAAGPPPDPPPS
jgi:AMIN domain